MIVYGRNAIREALNSGNAETLFTLKRFEKDPLIQKARERHVSVKFVDESELTRMTKNSSHQGFVAISKDVALLSLDALIEHAKQTKYPLLLMLDGLEDPHNLGAILRTADALGVDGIIIKNRGEVSISPTVAKVSTGALFYVNVCEVTNLSRAIETLQKNGYWIVASDGEAKENYDQVDYKSPICLIVGSEGFGISKLVLSKSDFVVKIPMVGHVNSLNASVSAAILIAQIQLSRK
ncbi:MAG: 23S rRNA (guanosine(2251)-2'-O)-methyltransferase RlmB [Bacilli bacterium]|nr:23S rRNA (guanosine(2251)-2'-O)-methyltransferase RlmB [Bacilli bacterium]